MPIQTKLPTTTTTTLPTTTMMMTTTTTMTSESVVHVYRYDLHPVRLLIDLVCLPNCIADEPRLVAFCEQLSNQLARAAALTDGVSASESDVALVDDTLKQLHACTEHANTVGRPHSLVLAALRQPNCMVSLEWQTELRLAWQQMAQTPFFASFLRADLASLATMQHPAVLVNVAVDSVDDDGLFGLGATANQNRWAESATDEASAAARERLRTNLVSANVALLRTRATLCHFHLQGQCAKGAACEFAHVGPSMATVCTFFRTGTCTRGNDCNYVHDARMAPCVSILQRGAKCAETPCPFSHDLALADFYEATQKRRQLAQQLPSQQHHQQQQQEPAQALQR
jgi:hypothetical protein